MNTLKRYTYSHTSLLSSQDNFAKRRKSIDVHLNLIDILSLKGAFTKVNRVGWVFRMAGNRGGGGRGEAKGVRKHLKAMPTACVRM